MGAIPADAANLNPDTHGFPGVEQRPDLVVAESSEPEGGAFDASGQVVDGYLEGLALLWLGAWVSCGRHVVDGGGGAVLALVA